jgi:hypothetical protein
VIDRIQDTIESRFAQRLGADGNGVVGRDSGIGEDRYGGGYSGGRYNRYSGDGGVTGGVTGEVTGDVEEATRSMRRVWKRIESDQLLILTGAAIACFPDSFEPAYGLSRSSRMIREELVRLGAFVDARGRSFRPYQLEAIRAGVWAPGGRGVLDLATGAGKTWIAYGIASVVGGSWLYLAPNIGLLEQSQKEFRELDKMSGRVDMTVRYYATYGTIGRMIEEDTLPAMYAGVLCDEAHRLGALTYIKGMQRVRSVRRIGLSATPFLRSDDRNSFVCGLVGPVVYKVGMPQLVEMGALSPGAVKVCDSE